MSASPEAPPSPLDTLLRCLDLEEAGGDLHIGDPGPGTGRLFGGMVAAQSVVAATRSVPDERALHSLHAYFLRGGRHDTPIRFQVERIRDGRSFSTRRVKAVQADETIFELAASYAVPEDGIEHQDPMPATPLPHELPSWEEVRAKLDRTWPIHDSPIEVRMADPWSTEPCPPHQRNWMRVRGKLPEDPRLHTALLIYATDRLLLGTASRPHGLNWRERAAASLDHAVWIHRPVRLDDWVLYTGESPVAYGAHAMIFGGIYYPDGRRLASVAQEGLIRRRPPQP